MEWWNGGVVGAQIDDDDQDDPSLHFPAWDGWDGLGRLWDGCKSENRPCTPALGRWDGRTPPRHPPSPSAAPQPTRPSSCALSPICDLPLSILKCSGHPDRQLKAPIDTYRHRKIISPPLPRQKTTRRRKSGAKGNQRELFCRGRARSPSAPRPRTTSFPAASARQPYHGSPTTTDLVPRRPFKW
jgi:hypothetical protein